MYLHDGFDSIRVLNAAAHAGTQRNPVHAAGAGARGGLCAARLEHQLRPGHGQPPRRTQHRLFLRPRLALPQSWDELRDPHRSPLNPLWDVERQERRGFTYGHLPLYLGTAMGELFHVAAPVAERVGVPAGAVAVMARADAACDAIAVAGRFTIALFDTLTILLLFLLGRRLYGPWAGLLTATFYAFTAQAIQLSHFFAMDPASTTFTVWTVLAGVYMAQSRRWSTAVLTGVMAGLAIASKFSALPILAVPVVAGFLVFWDAHTRRAADDARVDDVRADVGRADFFAVAAPLLALVTAFVAFFLTSPYAVLDWRNFIQATLVEQGQMVRGVADFPFTRQYRNTTPYVYFVRQQVVWGLGLALGVVTVAGVVAALLVLLRTVFNVIATVVDHLRGLPLARHRRRGAGRLLAWAVSVPYFVTVRSGQVQPLHDRCCRLCCSLRRGWCGGCGGEGSVKREDVKRDGVKREDVMRDGAVEVEDEGEGEAGR
ncbi:MAG: glycosyltransferase family 39 protein [Caldilineaceae bacterium]